MKKRKESGAMPERRQVLREWAERLLMDEAAVETMPAETVYRIVNELQTRKIELEAQNERLRQMAPQDIQELVRELERQNSELRRTQEELKASRNRYIDLYNSAPIGYFTMDKTRHIIEMNPAGARLLGMEPENLGKIDLTDFVSREFLNTFSNYCETVFEMGTAGACELKLKRSDDSIVYVRLESMAVPEADGSFKLCRVAAVDITERMKSEESLLASEHKYRQLVENMEEGVAILDTSARFTFVNPRLAEMLGYTREEMIGKQALSFMDEYGVELYKKYLKYPENEIKRALEFELTRRDGTRIYTQLEASPINDEHGKFAGIIACVNDITDRVAAEQAALNSQKQVKSLIDSNIIGIAIIDLDGNIIEANDAYLNIIGYSRDDLAANRIRWSQLVPAEYVQLDRKAVDELLMTGCCRPYEKEYVRKDGSRIPVLIGSSLWETSSSRPLFVCFALDISEQKRVEKEREALLRQVTEHRQWLEGVLDQAPGGIVIAEVPSGRIIFGNQQVAKIWGAPFLAADNVSQYGVYKGFHKNGPPYLPEEWPLARSVSRGETVTNEEIEFPRGDGMLGTMLVSSCPVRDRQGNVMAAVATFNDITDTVVLRTEREHLLKQIEKEKQSIEELAHILAREKDILETAIENTGAMLAYLDSDFNFVKVNSTYAMARGYTIDELVGQNHFQMFPDEENKAICRYVIDTGKSVTLHDKPFNLSKDYSGTTYFDWTLTPVLDDSGKVQGLVISLVETTQRKLAEEVLQRTKDDLEIAVAERTAELMIINEELQKEISERKQAQEELQQKAASLRLILEQMPLMMWTTDRELRITSTSGAALSILSLQPGQTVGMTIFEHFGTDDPDYPPIRAHHRALEGMPSTYQRNEAGKMLCAYLEPWRDSNGDIIGVIGAAIDISEREQMENELRRVSRRLVEAQENERRNIARELHDQVSQSLALLKILLDKAMRSPADKDKFNWNDAESVVMEIIGQIRDMSMNLRPRMLDDLGLLPTLLWHLDRYSGQTHISVNFKHAGLKKKFASEVSTAAYRIVQEALSNVARHAQASEVAVRVWANHETVSIRVKDDGIGFDPAKLNSAVSTGLSGMRERIMLLGGKFDIDTTPGKGTCITAQLPIQGWAQK